jgi:hypothetical protein
MKVLHKTFIVSIVLGLVHFLVVSCEENLPLIDFSFEHKDLKFEIDSTINSSEGEFLFLDTVVKTNIDSLIDEQDADKEDIKEIRADSINLEILNPELNFDFLKSARITISTPDNPGDVVQITQMNFVIPLKQLRVLVIPTRDEDLVKFLEEDSDEFRIRIYINRRLGTVLEEKAMVKAYIKAVAKVGIL